MNEMYKRIEDLCKARGVNMTAMCREAGVPRSNLSDLKYGRTAALATVNLNRIAKFFDVPMDYLLGKDGRFPPVATDILLLSADSIDMEGIKKTPTPEGEREDLKERVYAALQSAEPAIREAALRLLGVQE